MATRGWQDVTAATLARLGKQAPKPAPTKYRNVKVVVDGITFDSKREAGYYLGLKARLAAGEIRDLRRQAVFALLAPSLADGFTVVVAHYIADFTYVTVADAVLHVVDAKGLRTKLYALKKRWLEAQTGIQIEEV